MNLTPTLLFLGALLLSTSCGNRHSETDETELQGDFRTKQISEAFILNEDSLDISDFFIQMRKLRKNRANQTFDDLDLSRFIITAASAVQIDPRVLFCLIRMESGFDEVAESPTGAMGLTQFTNQGLQEVYDQLGARGKAEAYGPTVEYWKALVPPLYENLVADASNITDKTFDFPNATSGLLTGKKALKSNPVKAIIYGAILLKTNLAAVRYSKPDLSMRELYIQALERYNGGTGLLANGKTEKVNYRESILGWVDNLYY